MSLGPEFLDELRTRLPVSEVVGKTVRLIRKGREFLGLCPFHTDSKPSMNVVDDKNFYHCFACGAHGDIISFVMGTEGLSFMDTVEKLASMAGMDVPKPTPEAREHASRAKTLHDVLEAACVWYEAKLHEPTGAEGLTYFQGRGLSARTIGRFRLGYAPDRRGGLGQALKAQGYPEALLLEAGLLRQPEDGREAYDYFRGRVIFPITDRRGRVIAFGGRVMGDGQPKYLNSPDTPVFHKGRVLYGLDQAREAVRKNGELVVAEGYMDVIALAEAGIANAVAPLGTALTEEQIAEMWKLSAEPVICFDGDTAGMKAAQRAAERALPILKPGHSLGFVSLPEGQDPDDLIRSQGVGAVRELLGAATPLSQFLWQIERGMSAMDTPERLADFQNRIRARVRDIADREVQQAYSDMIEARVQDLRNAGREAARGKRFQPGRGAPGRRSAAPAAAKSAHTGGHRVLFRRREAALLAILIDHPHMLEISVETLAHLTFDEPFLDKLRAQIIDIAIAEPGLDAVAMRRHLSDLGYSETCDGFLDARTMDHAAFATRAENLEDGLVELLSRIARPQLEAQIAEAHRVIADDLSEDNWNRVTSLRASLEAITVGSLAAEAD